MRSMNNKPKVMQQAQVIVIRNRLFYMYCWNLMSRYKVNSWVDPSGQVQYCTEVANILRHKYKYDVVNAKRIQ